jgi:hypothetical protein
MMMSEMARMRHNPRDRQKRHIQNEPLLSDLCDECFELHLETKEHEEAARRKAAAQIEQRQSMEGPRLIGTTRKPQNGQQLSAQQIAQEYLLKKIREVKLDIRRLLSEKSVQAQRKHSRGILIKKTQVKQ